SWSVFSGVNLIGRICFADDHIAVPCKKEYRQIQSFEFEAVIYTQIESWHIATQNNAVVRSDCAVAILVSHPDLSHHLLIFPGQILLPELPYPDFFIIEIGADRISDKPAVGQIPVAL